MNTAYTYLVNSVQVVSQYFNAEAPKSSAAAAVAEVASDTFEVQIKRFADSYSDASVKRFIASKDFLCCAAEMDTVTAELFNEMVIHFSHEKDALAKSSREKFAPLHYLCKRETITELTYQKALSILRAGSRSRNEVQRTLLESYLSSHTLSGVLKDKVFVQSIPVRVIAEYAEVVFCPELVNQPSPMPFSTPLGLLASGGEELPTNILIDDEQEFENHFQHEESRVKLLKLLVAAGGNPTIENIIGRLRGAHINPKINLLLADVVKKQTYVQPQCQIQVVDDK